MSNRSLRRPRRKPALAPSYAPFVAPAVVLGVVLIGGPILVMAALSLADWNLTATRLPSFAGLGNYGRMLADSAFWGSLGTTLQFTAESVLLQLVLGIGIALLFNRDWPGLGLVRALFLAPMMIAPLFVGMVWRLLLSDDFGIVKYLLVLAGVEQPPLWLGDPAVALQAVVMVSVWEWTGFVVLFALAGLQGVPPELYEAAGLDGAGALRRFWSITLPLLRPTVIAVALFRAIDGFKVFDLVFAMTGGGPGDSTTTMAYFVYQQGITFFDLGYSSTLALVTLVLVILLASPLLRLSGRAEPA